MHDFSTDAVPLTITHDIACKVVDEYLLQRGRLNNLSFSFLQPKPEGNAN